MEATGCNTDNHWQAAWNCCICCSRGNLKMTCRQGQSNVMFTVLASYYGKSVFHFSP